MVVLMLWSIAVACLDVSIVCCLFAYLLVFICFGLGLLIMLALV